MSHVSYLSNLTPDKFNATVERMVKLIKEHYPTANVLAGGAILISSVGVSLTFSSNYITFVSFYIK